MLVGISEAIRLLFFNFSPIRKTIRNYSTLSLPTNTNKVGIGNPNDTCNIFNQWLAGLIDGDGSVYLKSSQIFITASQKNKLLLDPLVELYGGSIYTLSKVQAFKWSVYKKEEIIRLF